MGIRWILALHTSDVLHIPPFSCYMHPLWLCLPTYVSCPAQGLCAVTAVTLVFLQSLPLGGAVWHRGDAYSAMKSFAGSDYSRQQEGPAYLPAPSVSYCWISEQWGWGLLCSCIAAVAVLPAPWLDPNFSGSYLHLNCSS